MSSITLRLPDNVINQMSIKSKQLNISRSEYIRRSIENMNELLEKEVLRSQLLHASQRVRQESMVVNQEFSEIENNE